MKKLVYQHHKGDMRGDMFKTEYGYYYKIFYNVNGKYKLIGQSYVNLFDKELCRSRMIHDMDIIDEAKTKRLK